MRICNFGCLQGGAGQGGGVVRDCHLVLHGTHVQPQHYKKRIADVEETGESVNSIDGEIGAGKIQRSSRFGFFIRRLLKNSF
jgi:hypothetical protein